MTLSPGKASRASERRRFLAPEVVQTSAMDCGPASLKCLLEGLGIPVSYERLREACQTDVDGTSIDTLEDIAQQLGIDAEQILIPKDHLASREADVLPSIVVVKLPNGATHFVVVWRRMAGLTQVMDPATGRRWPTTRAFLDEVYEHSMRVPAEAWREWAGKKEFLRPLSAGLEQIGLSEAEARKLIERALDDVSWRSIATLDGALRMARALVGTRGVDRGRFAANLVESLFNRSLAEPLGDSRAIPAIYWSARSETMDPADSELTLKGAVLVRVRRRKAEGDPASQRGESPQDEGESAMAPELAAALEEQPFRPGLELLRLLRADGLFAPAALLLALLLSSGAVLVQALLFRGLLDIGRDLTVPEQRLSALSAVLVFLTALVLIELPISSSVLRMGRHLEARMRIVFQKTIPHLADRYFKSRLNSDMAERGHSALLVRGLPGLGVQMIRLMLQLVMTAAGIIWLDPASAPWVILCSFAAVTLPLAAQRMLGERELRIRSHRGALSRFYLDSMLGLVPVRTHGAERAMRREHESLLVEWWRANVRLRKAAIGISGLQSLMTSGLAAWIVISHLTRGGEIGGMLLLCYWVLALPNLGQELVGVAQQYPSLRNVTARMFEPLGAPETGRTRAQRSESGSTQQEVSGQAALGLPQSHLRAAGVVSMELQREEQRGRFQGANEKGPSAADGVSIDMRAVSVRACGHTILHDLDLRVEPGEHVAVVGRSGAGKSTLVGLLLGWHRSASGGISIDGSVLDERTLSSLRRDTAWVDPGVQLWNQPLLDNLLYGSKGGDRMAIGAAIEAAELKDVLESLPMGLQNPLGEGGGLLSGGEGQRVRLARSMLRSQVRLAILDEPFRGLDRSQRGELLRRARELWKDATLFCVTHDIEQTRAFDRVLVIEEGRIVEDGPPAELSRRIGSSYRALIEAEASVAGLWRQSFWRRMRVEGGTVERAQEGGEG